MFCLRYFIIVALLPIPVSSPPIMLALWLVSFLLHQRPCLYCSILICGFLASTCNRNIAGPSEDEALSRCWLPFDRAAWLEPFAFREPLVSSNATAVARSLKSWTSRIPWRDELVFKTHSGAGFRIWLGLGRPPKA